MVQREKYYYWPAQSSDLNPIENMWDNLKRAIQDKNPKNTEKLWKSVKEAWNEIPCERFITLFDSMTNRCKAVIKTREGPTSH